MLQLDPKGLPHLEQRGTSGILAGMWGPVIEEHLEVDSLEYLGEIKHVLSHRDLYVRVWRGTVPIGVDPATVPLSSLDLKILSLGGVN